MKKNKFSEESQEVLNLGSLHEEIQYEKKRKKNLSLPLIFIFCGVCLILSGVYYTDIEKFFDKIVNPPKKELTEPVNGITILTCNYNNEDKTIGLITEKTIIYRFKDNLLKKVTDNTKISIIENNYDIGSNNIKVYKQKYDKVLNPIKINGLNINIKLEKEILTKEIVFDLNTLDITKIPKVNYLSFTNKKDQSYREIKEVEGRAGHICKVSYE